MKKFLTAFAGIAAAFAADATTTVASGAVIAPTKDAQNVAAPQAFTLGENIRTTNAQGDQFDFVLKRSEDTGLMMAWHSSHSSHASHASHASHYSSRR